MCLTSIPYHKNGCRSPKRLISMPTEATVARYNRTVPSRSDDAPYEIGGALIGPDRTIVTGYGFLIDDGVTASYEESSLTSRPESNPGPGPILGNEIDPSSFECRF